jgi:large exoprotein involved in heme utilization and adhesion
MTKLVEQKVAPSCRTGVLEGQSQFVITGRGGVPNNPLNIIRSNQTLELDWVSIKRGNSTHFGEIPKYISNETNADYFKRYPDKIVEAQSWVRSFKGDLYLVANTSDTKNNTHKFPHEQCGASAMVIIK